MAIEAGMLVEAMTASGTTVRMRATGQPVQGRDFPVVWVCTEEEWDAAPGEIAGIPWPLDSVHELDDAALR